MKGSFNNVLRSEKRLVMRVNGFGALLLGVVGLVSEVVAMTSDDAEAVSVDVVRCCEELEESDERRRKLKCGSESDGSVAVALVLIRSSWLENIVWKWALIACLY